MNVTDQYLFTRQVTQSNTIRNFLLFLIMLFLLFIFIYLYMMVATIKDVCFEIQKMEIKERTVQKL